MTSARQRRSFWGCTALWAAIAACSPVQQEPQQVTAAREHAEEAESEEWTGESLVLTARVLHAPQRWEDGEVKPDAPLAFTVPRELPVIYGNAGNHLAELRIRDIAGREYACAYRGGSSEESPSSPVEKARGRSYRLEACSNGLEAGSGVMASWLHLHLEKGDSQDPSPEQAVTQVELPLGGTLPELESPVSAEESVALREGFSWERTQKLPETNPEGHPALHYALIYVEQREQAEALDEMLIHWSGLPMFSQEMDRWQGKRGLFTFEGDGRGLFVFALMPAATYNLIRQYALEGEPLYEAIILRPVPKEARLEDDSVSYEALRGAGFLYRNLTPEDVESWEEAPRGQHSQELFNRIRRAIVRTVATVVRAVVRTVVRAIGVVDRFVTGSVDLAVRLDMRNTDPSFGVGTPMQRAWGAGAGQQVQVPGLRVNVRQRALSGLLPTLFTAQTDGNSTARMRVTRGKEATVCVDLINSAAEVTTWVIPVAACDFGSITAGQLNANFTFNVPVRHGYLNVLAQAHEGWSYLRDVAGYTPYRANILVGRLANAASLVQRGVALAPCFGFPNLAYDALVASVSGALARVPLIGFAASLVVRAAGPVYAVDIIVARDPNNGFDENFDSRGLLTHEYGHFALCSMLYSEGPENITVGYTDVILGRISGGGDPGPNDEPAYLNEAFADFFAGQVVSGTNYFDANQTAGWPYDNLNMGMHYCPANASACLDGNRLDTGSFTQQVARITTLLHDAFDGRPSLPAVNVPENGDAWLASSPLLQYSPFVRTGSSGDEAVRLGGPSLRRLINRWDARGWYLTQQNFLGALSDVMVETGHNWCTRCRAFALHDWRQGTLPDAEICNQQPIVSWIGPGGC